MSTDAPPPGLAEKVEACGMKVIEASIGTMINTCNITTMTAGHVVLQQAMRALYIMGGVDAAHYAMASARRLIAEDRGDEAGATKHAKAERLAFERMTTVFDAQVERMLAGGLQ